MYMRKILFYLFLLTVTSIQANPVDDILERIDKGASRKFQTILVKSDKDFLRLTRSLILPPTAGKLHLLSSSEATLG